MEKSIGAAHSAQHDNGSVLKVKGMDIYSPDVLDFLKSSFSRENVTAAKQSLQEFTALDEARVTRKTGAHRTPAEGVAPPVKSAVKTSAFLVNRSSAKLKADKAMGGKPAVHGVDRALEQLAGVGPVAMTNEPVVANDTQRARKEANNHKHNRKVTAPVEKKTDKPRLVVGKPLASGAPMGGVPHPTTDQAVAPAIPAGGQEKVNPPRAPVRKGSPTPQEVLNALSDDDDSEDENAPDDGCGDDHSDDGDSLSGGYKQDPACILVPHRGFYTALGKVYRKSVVDGAVLVPYDPASKKWEGESFPCPYIEGREGSIVSGFGKVAPGHYCKQSGLAPVVLASSFSTIDNFVIEAREFVWLKAFRKMLIDTARTVSFGLLYQLHPYTGLTRITKSITFIDAVYAHLRDDKVANGVTPEQVTLLSRAIFAKFPQYPIEMLIETLLFFTFQRAAAFSEMRATTAALSSFIQGGNRVRAYREPFNTNVTTGALIAGEDDITQQGWYHVNPKDQCMALHGKGMVSIHRVPYVRSADAHGSATNRTKAPGGKYEEVSTATRNPKSPFNKNCGFRDPYPWFKTDTDPKGERCYQTVGGAFATKMAVVDHKDPKEVARCFLRMSVTRPDEWELRDNQIRAFAPAWQWFNENYNEPGVNNPIRPDGVDFDNRLTASIREVDPLYERDDLPNAQLPLSELQEALRCAHRLYVHTPVDPQELAGIVQNPVKAIHDYIDIVGGPKAPMRHVEAARYLENPCAQRKRYNEVHFKPDEAQKYKYDKDSQEMKLKFGRATISITGQEWVHANPPLLYAMKHLIEREFTWRKVDYGAYKSVMEMDGYQEMSVAQPVYDLWYRACLSSTDGDSLSALKAQMIAWCLDAPDRMAALSHGDDIDIIRSESDGRLVAEEADISDNDGSYTDLLLRVEAQRIVPSADPTVLFSQLANPLLLINPSNNHEKILLRSRTGMVRCSGAIDTTFGNTVGSSSLVLAYALQGPGRDGVVQAARSIGFNVTCQVFGDLCESTFLSKFSVVLDWNKGAAGIVTMTCFASMFRNLGRCTGDLPGKASTPVCDRWMEYMKGIIKGYVNEPDTLLMRAMRIKYDPAEYGVFKLLPECLRPSGAIKAVRRCITRSREKMCSPIDLGVIEHYYGIDERDKGIGEYLDCVRLIDESPAFGTIIACAFIDRIMAKRYGMAPVIA